MKNRTKENEGGGNSLCDLVRNKFYWVNERYEGWRPAQYAGGKDGHYFWPIGMDYEYRLGQEITAVGDEITIPDANREAGSPDQKFKEEVEKLFQELRVSSKPLDQTGLDTIEKSFWELLA